MGISLVCRLGPGFSHPVFALVDYDFAKEQLKLMLRSQYFHPNGQIPAYEWNFSDVNPPVHPGPLLSSTSGAQPGREDKKCLERSFQGLNLNFNWWVTGRIRRAAMSLPVVPGS